jgi:hypothetical protein
MEAPCVRVSLTISLQLRALWERGHFWSDYKLAKPDLTALNDPTRDFELVEPRTKGFWLTIGSAIFVAIAIMMLADEAYDQKAIAWGIVIFFGLGVIIGAIKLFGKPDTIKFDQEGFAYVNLGKSIRMEWEQLTGFGTYKVGPPFGATTMVGMNLNERMQSAGTALAHGLAGFDGALPTSYGVKPMVLAQAMQTRMEAAHTRR